MSPGSHCCGYFPGTLSCGQVGHTWVLSKVFFQMSYSDLSQIYDTKIIVPVIATKVACPIKEQSKLEQITKFPCIMMKKIILIYIDVMMSAVASQITGISMVCSTVCSGTNQRKHQSSASLAFVRGIYRWPVEMFPFNDVIMLESRRFSP